MTRPLDHVDLVVTDFEGSLNFYLELLAPLGWRRTGRIRGERGEPVQYMWGGGGALSLRQTQSDAHAVPYDRYAVGVHHLAFGADSRERVDERYRWLLDHGAEIETPPKEYDYRPGYYAVFFYDPDGIKLEILHVPERD
jgi:catechol 2,3-dioxygenase-like lactoylglutathione lyase family enzyme